jgi:hypothetical protein
MAKFVITIEDVADGVMMRYECIGTGAPIDQSKAVGHGEKIVEAFKQAQRLRGNKVDGRGRPVDEFEEDS